MVSRLLVVACYITVHKMSLTTRLAAIDSVGGDTGVKPEHVTSLAHRAPSLTIILLFF